MRRQSAAGACLGGGSMRRGQADDLAVRDEAAAGLTIESALFGNRLETLGQTDHGLGAAEHEKAVTLGAGGHALKHADLGRLIEVDQHVAAKHHVEHSEAPEV